MGKSAASFMKRFRFKEILLLCGLAVLLVIACYEVFVKDEKIKSVSGSVEELRLKEILQTIAGVGEAEVMIGESENGVKSVVIVCDGANNLSVLIDLREAAAAAIGIDEKNVKIYLKNKQ